jgi:hypothetical protein
MFYSANDLTVDCHGNVNATKTTHTRISAMVSLGNVSAYFTLRASNYGNLCAGHPK